MSRDRKTLPFRFAGPLVAVAAATVAVSNPASAQDDCYRVVDLGAIGFTPFIDNVFGMNNQNQAVYSVNVEPGGMEKLHAFLYLPAPAYGFTEPGRYDLHLLANIPAGETSAAHDINENGIVAGYRTVDGQRHAFIWRLDLNDPMNPPVPTSDLGTFDPGDWSEAWAINNVNPFPIIVGEGDSAPTADATTRAPRAIPSGADLPWS